MATSRYLGVDLAWREGRADLPANETGVAVIDPCGQILDAGWRRGVDEAVAWADALAGDADAVMFVDAPLVVRNETGQRLCETQVGQRYGRWKVSANTTNLASPRLAGVRFLALAQERVAVLRRPRRATGHWPHPVGELPLRHAGRRSGTGLRHRAAALQAQAATAPGSPVATRAGRELRHADPPPRPAGDRRSAATAAIPPGCPAACRAALASR